MVFTKSPTKSKDIPATRQKAKVWSGQRKKNPSVPAALSHESIAERAYQIWESSGCSGEGEVDNWVEAERELRGRFA